VLRACGFVTDVEVFWRVRRRIDAAPDARPARPIAIRIQDGRVRGGGTQRGSERVLQRKRQDGGGFPAGFHFVHNTIGDSACGTAGSRCAKPISPPSPAFGLLSSSCSTLSLLRHIMLRRYKRIVLCSSKHIMSEAYYCKLETPSVRTPLWGQSLLLARACSRSSRSPLTLWSQVSAAGRDEDRFRPHACAQGSY
jgi:hypothetical protein